MKHRNVGAELFHTVGRADRRTDMKLIIAFALYRTRLKVMKELTEFTIFASHFPAEGVLVVSIPVLRHSKFLKPFLYVLQENDSAGV